MTRKVFLSVFIIILFGSITFSAVANLVYAATSGEARNSRSDLEEQILQATVRIKVESWVVRPDESGYDIDSSTGHGTVTGGRYLVTHNHFSVPLSILKRQASEGSYGVVYLYNSRGDLLHKGPLSDFEVAREAVETLVFAHKDQGFFDNLGFSSAPIAAGAPPSPGVKVAQINWNGTVAHVDWVEVQTIILDDGAPRLVLGNSVLPGASGGGIFWNGEHVANNWRLEEKMNGAGAVVAAVTAAALNPEGMADLR